MPQPRETRPRLAAWQERRRLRQEITGRFTATRGALSKLYAGQGTEAEKREGKAQLLAALSAEVRAIEQKAGRTTGYGSWIDAGLNNAHLALVATYYERVPQFEALLRETCGGYHALLSCAGRWPRSPEERKEEIGPRGSGALH